MQGCWSYVLRCRIGSYYVRTSRQDDLETRVSQRNLDLFGGYAARRRPVRLAYSVHYDRITDAIAYERRVEGWTRSKTQALIRGDFDLPQELAKRRSFTKQS